MLCVETIGKIRRRRLVQGESISSIARGLGVSRNTIKRALKVEGDGYEYRRKRQPMSKLGPFKTLLDRPEGSRRVARQLRRAVQRLEGLAPPTAAGQGRVTGAGLARRARDPRHHVVSRGAAPARDCTAPHACRRRHTAAGVRPTQPGASRGRREGTTAPAQLARRQMIPAREAACTRCGDRGALCPETAPRRLRARSVRAFGGRRGGLHARWPRPSRHPTPVADLFDTRLTRARSVTSAGPTLLTTASIQVRGYLGCSSRKACAARLPVASSRTATRCAPRPPATVARARGESRAAHRDRPASRGGRRTQLHE